LLTENSRQTQYQCPQWACVEVVIKLDGMQLFVDYLEETQSSSLLYFQMTE